MSRWAIAGCCFGWGLAEESGPHIALLSPFADCKLAVANGELPRKLPFTPWLPNGAAYHGGQSEDFGFRNHVHHRPATKKASRLKSV